MQANIIQGSSTLPRRVRFGVVAQDYEAAETTQTALEIAFPIVVVLLLVAVVWFVVRRVRRRKVSQVSS